MNVIKANDIEQPFRIGIVVSRFNENVTQRLYEGAVQRLNELKITSDLISVAHVPGAVEIPIACQRFIDTDEIHVVIALGAVIKQETDHYDYVCSMVSKGCMDVSLESGIPVVFGVLTCPDEVHALERAGGAKGHAGIEAVNSAFEILSVVRQIDELTFE